MKNEINQLNEILEKSAGTSDVCCPNCGCLYFTNPSYYPREIKKRIPPITRFTCVNCGRPVTAYQILRNRLVGLTDRTKKRTEYLPLKNKQSIV